jgi:sodium transport system permease protein
MSLRNIGIVYRKELKDSLRDRRTLISMVVVPILIMPLLTIGIGVVSSQLVGSALKEKSKVMILGGANSPQVMAALETSQEITVVPATPNYADLISDKKLRAAVEIPEDFDARVARGEKVSVKVYDYKGDLKSGIAMEKVQKIFNGMRDNTVRQRLEAHNLPGSLIEPFAIDEENVVSPEKVAGAIVGGFLPYFIIILCLTGAMYPAMDLTAGEKERGTIETILCSPVSRVHLVLGKFLMVFTASVCTGILALTSMGASFHFAKAMLATMLSNGKTMELSIGLKAVAAIFFMVLPLAVLFASGLLAVSLFAKSYKEAQSYISPLMMVVIIPAIIAILPGTELDARLSLIPILNTSLVCKEIATGTYHWHSIGLIFVSTTVYAAIALTIAVKLFQREDVLFRT